MKLKGAKVMNARNENKVGMYVVTHDTMGDNESLWEEIPAIRAVVDALFGRIDNINGFAQTRSVTTKGLTAAKRAARRAMQPVTMEVAGMVRSYAASTDDHELLAKVDITPSRLGGLRDTVVGNVCL